jgi:hypothetical protein
MRRWVSDLFDRHPVVGWSLAAVMAAGFVAFDIERLVNARKAFGPAADGPILVGAGLAVAGLALLGLSLWRARHSRAGRAGWGWVAALWALTVIVALVWTHTPRGRWRPLRSDLDVVLVSYLATVFAVGVAAGGVVAVLVRRRTQRRRARGGVTRPRTSPETAAIPRGGAAVSWKVLRRRRGGRGRRD